MHVVFTAFEQLRDPLNIQHFCSVLGVNVRMDGLMDSFPVIKYVEINKLTIDGVIG